MQNSEDYMMTTVKVERGGEAEGDLGANGPLRFERGADAMDGPATITAENGQLTLRYADGSSVLIKD